MKAATEVLWPWLVVAGMGALHGLNPASGWAIAAAWGLHARNRAQAWWALLPLALGHAASVALVAAAVVFGLSLYRTALQVMAFALLIAVVGMHLWRRSASPRRWPACTAGIALGSFLLSGVHGAGLMLVPALVPLCLGTGSGSETLVEGPLALALAAVAVHMAAMLLVTGLMAAGACMAATRIPYPVGAVWRSLSKIRHAVRRRHGGPRSNSPSDPPSSPPPDHSSQPTPTTP